jgi:TonB family protein
VHRILIILTSALLLQQYSTPRARAQQVTQPRAAAVGTALRAYPDSPDGLKSLLNDVFDAVKSEDSAKYSAYFTNFGIPDGGAWLLQAFGASEGPRLKEKYAQLQPQSASDLKKVFEQALQGGRTEVAVQVYQEGAVRKFGVIGAALDAMSDPAQIYTATGNSPSDKFSLALGNFVYVDGGFRFLSGQVLQALSTALPARVRMGGNVMKAKLVNLVEPIYPPEAQSAHLKGVVRLHVVLATDGAPKEITVERGDPAFAKAAVDAVRQWRYAPTTLNGAAVEIDTTIDIEFK